MKLSVLTFFVCAYFFSLNLHARIQYAAKHRINRCTACHVSPVGGSLRTKAGKAYGQHGFAAGPFSDQDWVSADVRMIYFQPENTDTDNGGLGIMNGQVGVNVPVMEKGPFPYETRLVYSQNIGGFGGTTPRNAFIRWKFEDDTETSFLPQYVMLGRFHAPFGALTDEHRTYVRLQNNTTWNNFEMGALFAANPFESLHYDVALVNGEKTAGTGFGAGRTNDWGSIVNLRYAPAWLPLFVGASYSRHSASTDVLTATQNNSNPESYAGYAVIPLQRISRWFPLTLTVEQQMSKNWNQDSGFINYLNSAGTYKDSIINSESVGQLLRADLHLTQTLDLIYQYDSLLLNKDFDGDTYTRQGIGLRWVMGPNMLINVRQETASGGTNTESAMDSRAKQKALWLVLQVGI